MSRKTIFTDLGVMDYQEAWDLQTNLHEELKAIKIKARRSGQVIEPLHHLLFVEHNHVYTLGKSGKIDNLKYSEKELESEGIKFYKINRGGDITYHGKGQLTIYPIFDLDDFFHDVHKYVRLLEEVIIRFLDDKGVKAYRREAYTGVWVKHNEMQEKICAIGVHLSRWVSMHGLAFNINTNLDYFKGIIPCGIADSDSKVCSLESLLDEKQNLAEVKLELKAKFKEVFDLEYVTKKEEN